MSEWKLIESAPKDGSRILVCGGTVPGVEIATAWPDGIVCELYEDRRIPSDPPDEPENWMPLPAPPTAPEGAEKP